MIAQRETYRDRGVILLNALIMVVAISAIAAALLLLVVRDRTRFQTLRDADQAQHFLDAGETLVALVLEEDFRQAADVDDLTELWAIDDYVVPIDRGMLGGRIWDLQGRFNVNRLSDPDDIAARQAFDRLVQGLGLPVTLSRSVADFLAPGGPANPAPYFNRTIPVKPRGGGIAVIEELRSVPGMTVSAFDVLLPFVAALPPESPVNLNTAPPQVLAALLPAIGPRGAETVLQLRGQRPFGSTGEFGDRLRNALGPDRLDGVALGGFSVRSNRFVARLEVTLDSRSVRRMIYLIRSPQSGDVTRHYRTALP